MSHRSVFCIAPSPETAVTIVAELHDAGIAPADLSLLFLGAAPGTAGATGGADALARAELTAHPDTGPLAVPGLPSLRSSGPMVAPLAGAAHRGIAAGLVDFGIPEPEADRYDGKIQAGSVLIAIRASNPDQSDRARTIFRTNGAEDVRTIMVIEHRGDRFAEHARGVATGGFLRPSFGRHSRPARARNPVSR